jgi:hypothetical protein
VAQFIGFTAHFNSLEDVRKLCDINWTPQCKVVILASLISLINSIWFIRNQSRFNNRSVHWTTAVNLILSDVALAGNKTKQTFLFLYV